MITLGTLCSGIGLIDLGLERAGLGPVRWQCEVLPERRAVLEHHWPQVKRYDDVHTIRGSELEWVDCIAFGSPCKNLSSAGDRSGLDGPSSRLFWECLRIVAEVRPRWVIFENVASGASLYVDRVRNALEQYGYASLPIPLAASDCGAPHRRGRVFVVAYSDVVIVRDESRRRGGANGACSDVTPTDGNTDGEGEPTRALDAKMAGASDIDERPWGAPVPDLLRVVHGSADRMDGARARISALGDSCTPQQAEVIGCIVRILDEARTQ